MNRRDARARAVGAAGQADAGAGRRVQAAAVVAAVAVAALHVVRAELDPRSHRLSEYAVGTGGWLMAVAFAATAAAVWWLQGVLPEALGARVVRWLLAVAAAGLVIAAVVPTDVTATVPLREAVHSLASSGATVALTAAAVWTVTVARAPMAWGAARGAVTAAAAVAVVGVLVGPIAHDGPWTGLVQRVTWLALVGWLVLAGRARCDPGRRRRAA